MTIDDVGLDLSRAEIAARSKETPFQVDELVSNARLSVLRQMFSLTYFCFFSGPRTKNYSTIEQQALEIGFESLSVSRHGPLPLLLKTPEYFGPRGVTKLQIYGGKRPYLITYFSNGTGITSSLESGSNANTAYLQLTGDFVLDYQTHIAAVENRIRTGSVSPLYVADVEALRAVYRLFPVFLITDSDAAKFLITSLGILIAFVYAVVQVASLFVVNAP